MTSKLYDINNHIHRLFDMSIDEKGVNGIQIENNGEIQHIYSAVDFSMELLEKTSAKNSLYLVHHGIFWGECLPIVNRQYQFINSMIKNNNALIALHLPLDFHSTMGNNVLLAQQLNLTNISFFGDYKGHSPLTYGEIPNTTYKDFIHNIHQLFPPFHALSHGRETVSSIAICTGGGLSYLEEVKKRGCDTFITGDAHHIYYHLSKELKINLISIGHYNSEILGIKKLGETLSQLTQISNSFIDIPTHL